MKKYAKKEEVIDIINTIIKKDENMMIFSDDNWTYPLDLPTHLRDARNSIMLDTMINIEKRAGILIYIPNKTLDSIHSEHSKQIESKEVLNEKKSEKKINRKKIENTKEKKSSIKR